MFPTPLAHELWFTDRVPGGDASFLFEPRTLGLLAVAVALTLGVRAVARVRSGVDVPFLARLAPWMPFAVRVHLGVSLIGLLSAGAYLAPNLRLEAQRPASWLLGAAMVVTSVLLLAGWHTRVAAWLLVGLGPVGMLEFGPLAIIQRVDLLGLALFLVFAGPGRWSADAERGRGHEAGTVELARGVWALRVAAGVALIAVAYVEKLGNPALAQQFLASQDVQFNVPAALGLPVSDLEFVRVAGAIEVLFGLLLISGALPQLVVIAAGIPFNVTLFFFGTIEMLGHLPIYGAMLVLLVFGSDRELRPWCSRSWPFGRERSRGFGSPTARPQTGQAGPVGSSGSSPVGVVRIEHADGS